MDSTWIYYAMVSQQATQSTIAVQVRWWVAALTGQATADTSSASWFNDQLGQWTIVTMPWTYLNGVQTKPPCDKTPLVRLNPVQSKLPSFCCEYRDRDRQINSLRCSLCTLRRTKVMMYILQFNENTDPKFRRLYYYILLPVCF